MDMAELHMWESFVTENGPLHIALRIEAAIARAVVPFLGKQATVRGMMPWPKEPEPEATPEKVLLLFKNLATATKRKH
jgi:hypothetical protein